jgi:flagellar motility protein MotE (MotC chaperone)
MKNIPRILPLVGIAAAGVLAVNAMAGARGLPDLLSGAKAFAEEAAKPIKGAKSKGEGEAKEGEAVAPAASAAAADAAARIPPPAKPAAVCAPTAAELAKEAGLSPAELQVLQSLGTRRGQLDQRETDLNTQLALMAAAEAKLDAKVKSLNGLKADIQGLMGQANAKEQAEVDRMVKVFEAMKPKDAAPRITLLSDSVRLPIAAKMKERSLSAILAQMPPAEAKRLTESLAGRFDAARAVAAGADKAGSPASATVPAKTAAPAPVSVDPTAEPAPPKAAARKPAARKPVRKAAAKPAAKAAAKTASADPTAKPAAAPAQPAAATPAATPAKSG